MISPVDSIPIVSLSHALRMRRLDPRGYAQYRLYSIEGLHYRLTPLGFVVEGVNAEGKRTLFVMFLGLVQVLLVWYLVYASPIPLWGG